MDTLPVYTEDLLPHGIKFIGESLSRDKSSLESQISKLKLSLEQKDDDGRYKRSDSVELQLRDERNNLETELRRLKVRG